MSNQYRSISRFLSLILRHQPETIGLSLDPHGWAQITDVLEKSASHGRVLDAETLREVVATNDKQRFAISEDGQRIRASQGHSINVDLSLEAKQPPQVLYHGTATRFIESIFASGLTSRNRQYVHLSKDRSVALAVGKRHGVPAVLEVDCLAMQVDGHTFFFSENGVWLVDRVPARYLTLEDEDGR